MIRQPQSRFLMVLMALAGLLLVQPAAPAAAACGGTTFAGNETELNAAIADFNSQSGPCTFGITLTADVLLTASTTTIDNSTSDVALLLDGAGFTVDGQNSSGVRPFDIAADTTVTLRALTITGGNADANSRFGGGVLNLGTLTVDSSTIVGNVAYSFGAGIANTGTLTVNNSTVVDNGVNGGLITGGLDSSGATAVMTINNSTITGNSLGVYNGGGTLTISNSIVKGNDLDRECQNVGGTFAADHTFGSPGSFGCDLTFDNGNVLGVDPLLGPLQDNGGPTETMMLGVGSQAIGAGDNSGCEAADQRGVPRPVGSDCDMGAVEYTGQAAISGTVLLQSRTNVPDVPGVVTMSDTNGILPDQVVPFDAASGAFVFPSVPVLADNSSFRFVAQKPLFLSAELDPQLVDIGDALTGVDTQLKTGDATLDNEVDIFDLTCIGGAYDPNNPNVGACANGGSTDLNLDGNTNIFDLTVAGGNFGLIGPRPW